MEMLPLANFVRGLITEANPLTYPEGAALAMDNFTVKRNLSVDRRLGIDMEEAGVEVAFEYDPSASDVAVSVFSWRAVAQDGTRNYTVVQSGNQLKFFNSDSPTMSTAEVHSDQCVLIPGHKSQRMTFASVFGRLVVNHGTKRITVLEFDKATGKLEATLHTIKVRDLYGVEDGLKIDERPVSAKYFAGSSQEEALHRYNLYNQGWPSESWPCVKDKGNNGTTLVDPIQYTKSAVNFYPSNADIVWAAKVTAPGKDAKADVINSYSPWFLETAHLGSTEAAKGRYILDAFERGRSRWAEWVQNPLDLTVEDYELQCSVVSDTIPEPPPKYTVGDGNAGVGSDIQVVLPFIEYYQLPSIPDVSIGTYQVIESYSPTSFRIQVPEGQTIPTSSGKILYGDTYYDISATTPIAVGWPEPELTGMWNITLATGTPSEIPIGTYVAFYDQLGTGTQDRWRYGYDTDESVFTLVDVTGIELGDEVIIDGTTAVVTAIDSGLNTINLNRTVPAFDVISQTDQGASYNLTATHLDKTTEWWQTPGYSTVFPQYVLPEDRTEGTVSHVSYYAGRVWYAFDEENVVGGDNNSPSLGNTLLFSRVAKNLDDITSCHSTADPTAEGINEIVDSDGGYVTIPEMGSVLSLSPIGSVLLVLASNGVWQVSGGEGVFSAKSLSVSKVSSIGVESPFSVVEAEDSVYFLGEGGLYQVQLDPVSLKAGLVNLSETTIQSLLNAIPEAERAKVKGTYHPEEKRLRWLFNDVLALGTDYTRELVLDLTIQAFYTNTLGEATGAPVIVDYLLHSNEKQIGYLATRNSKVSFALERDVYFEDFATYLGGTGIDAPAEVIGGWITGGDTSRWKGAPYLITQCRQTETGSVDNGQGGIDFLTPSSCKARVMWDWTNRSDVGKWTPEFQAYKYTTVHPIMGPSGEGSGWEVSTSKRKVRGRGRAFTVRYATEPRKDLQLLGYTLEVSIVGKV